MSLQMSNTCVSRLLIPESDQIQIVVTKVVPERGKMGGTDITVTTMNRTSRMGITGMTNRRLPPLVLPLPNTIGSSGDERGRRLLSPLRGGSRIPSPNRRSSTTSVSGQGQGGSNIGVSLSSSASVPASPTTSTSRYHQTCCIPNSASLPSAFSQSASFRSRSRSRSRSPYRTTNSRNSLTGAQYY